MEEWIGLKWHRLVTRLAEPERAGGVALAELRRSVELLLHAGGARQRIALAQPVRVGGPRSGWQRLAGTGLRLPLPQLFGAAHDVLLQLLRVFPRVLDFRILEILLRRLAAA